MPWLVWMVVIGGAIAAVVSLASRAQVRKAKEAWAVAADQLGLRMVAGGHRGLAMAGNRGDLPIRIDVDQRSSGDSTETVTRYIVELPPLGVDIEVEKKTGWHGVLQFVGARDFSVDHAEFDDRFKLSTDHEARAKRYLNPQRIAMLLELSGRYPSVALSDDELRLETRGMASDASQIVTAANALLDAARVLEVPENEARYVLLGDRVGDDGAAERRDELEKIHDAIDDYVEIQNNDDPVPEEEASVEEAATAGATTYATTAAPDAVAGDLFGERQLGFESERRFEEHYRDTTVTWTGTVLRQGGLSAARVLGTEHALVELNVATLQDDLYGTSRIDAVVAFTAGTPQPERGATITFSGRLAAIDALTKDLYVADGRIE